jgi:hypothetical protein
LFNSENDNIIMGEEYSTSSQKATPGTHTTTHADYIQVDGGV